MMLGFKPMGVTYGWNLSLNRRLKGVVCSEGDKTRLLPGEGGPF